MNVLVDTAVWSLALRRSNPTGRSVALLHDLIEDGRAVMIGAVRQEILSGIRRQEQFDQLRDSLEPFVDLEVRREDHVRAAAFYNSCRTAGVQGSNTDFLICAVANGYDVPIFTTDNDFVRYSELLPVTLLRDR